MTEAITVPLRDLLAQKLIESRCLVGGQSKFLAPGRTREEILEDRKQCRKEYKLKHKDQIAKYQKEYQATHQEENRIRSREYLARKKAEKLLSD